MALNYTAWAGSRAQVLPSAIQGGGAIAVIERPDETLHDRVDEAFRAGVKRIICGFLPDEVDWRGPVWNSRLAYFLESFVFCPLRLETTSDQVDEHDRCILLTTDERQPKADDRDLHTLAQVWAQACRLPLVHVAINNPDATATVAAMCARAVHIFNDVQHWSWGFAIDELAARLGRPVLRLCNPGWSPLRYAVLGRDVVAANANDIPRIRPLLTAAPPTPVRFSDGTSLQERWLGWPGSATMWPALWRRAGYAMFWSGHENREFKVAKPVWLNRPAAWVGMASLTQTAAMSQCDDGVWKVVAHTVTAWMRDTQRDGVRAHVAELAMPRLMRLDGRWMKLFRELSDDSLKVRPQATRWLRQAIEWNRPDLSTLALVDEAQWAIAGTEAGPELSALLAWRRGDVGSLVKATWDPLGPAWCVACAEASLRVLREQGASPAAGLHALVMRGDIWPATLGAAGSFLRVVAAFVLRSGALARLAWRELFAAAALRSSGGVSLLVRAVWTRADLVQIWMVRTAILPATDAVLGFAALAAQWMRVRADSFWARELPPLVACEVAAAIRLTSDICQARPQQAGPFALLARLCAMAGDRDASMAAAQQYGQLTAGRYGDLAVTLALAWWRRGDTAIARVALESWPLPENAPGHHWFMCAVAAQLVSGGDVVTRALGILQHAVPRTLFEGSAAEIRQAWMAIVLRHAGDPAGATRWHERAATAFAAQPFLNDLYTESVASSFTLAPGWAALALS